MGVRGAASVDGLESREAKRTFKEELSEEGNLENFELVPFPPPLVKEESNFTDMKNDLP